MDCLSILVQNAIATISLICIIVIWYKLVQLYEVRRLFVLSHTSGDHHSTGTMPILAHITDADLEVHETYNQLISLNEILFRPVINKQSKRSTASKHYPTYQQTAKQNTLECLEKNRGVAPQI